MTATVVHIETRPALTDVQKRRRSAYAKGKRLELAVKAWLESEGWRVELAGKVLAWIYDATAGKRLPKSQHHDFFGVWDGVAVKGRARRFFQVTTLAHVADKRSKILASGFQAMREDRIIAKVGRARWRILRGPDFAMPGEEARWPTRRVRAVGRRAVSTRSRASSAPSSFPLGLAAGG